MFKGYTNHDSGQRSVAFSPDGQHIISAGSDDVVLVRDINDPRGHADNILALAYSPDERYFVSVSQDTTMILWRYDTLPELETWVRDNRYVPDL